MRRHQGFTLLQTLVVIAIIGVVAGMFSINLLRNIRAAELSDAAAQVVTDLRRARSQAQRSSTGVQVNLPGTAGGSSYTVAGQNRTVPNRITIACQRNCSSSPVTVTYNAPYGELGTTGSVFVVRSSANGVTPYEIRIVGVTGKIILTRPSS